MTNYQSREAKRLGLNRQIDAAEDHALAARMREVRAENIRRTAAAS